MKMFVLVGFLLLAGCAEFAGAKDVAGRWIGARIDHYCAAAEIERALLRNELNSYTKQFDVELICSPKGGF